MENIRVMSSSPSPSFRILFSTAGGGTLIFSILRYLAKVFSLPSVGLDEEEVSVEVSAETSAVAMGARVETAAPFGSGVHAKRLTTPSPLRFFFMLLLLLTLLLFPLMPSFVTGVGLLNVLTFSLTFPKVVTASPSDFASLADQPWSALVSRWIMPSFQRPGIRWRSASFELQRDLFVRVLDVHFRKCLGFLLT